jgi:tetratricopeptide (TPR) repeat protein
MKQLLSLVFVFFLFGAMSQTPDFNAAGKSLNYTTGKGEAGVKVSLIQSGNTIVSTTSSSDGGYQIKTQVDYSKPFFLVFEKNGYFQKRIEFDYSAMDIELLPAGEDVIPFQKTHTLDMISQIPNLDLSFLESEPIAVIYFDEVEGSLNDEGYYKKMRSKVDKLIQEAEAKNKGNDAAFQALFKEAENLYLTQKKYEDALVKYEQALDLKPTDANTLSRIDELDAIIQKLKEDELASQQSEKIYINLKNEADALRDQGKFSQAIEKYNEALKIREEQYPLDQIEYCQTQIENEEKYKGLISSADQFYNQKSYKAALAKYVEASDLRKNEQYPKDRIAACENFINEQSAIAEKKKQYDEMVTAADVLFDAKKWEEAKTKYAEAYALSSDSEYPQERIKLCDEELQKIKDLEAKKNKIADLLVAGEELFQKSAWKDAQKKFEEVLVEDASNTTAKKRLDEIFNKLKEEEALAADILKLQNLEKEGDQAVQSKDWNLAKQKYEEALKIKSEPTLQEKLISVKNEIAALESKNKKISELLAAGEEFYKLSKWKEAKAKYQLVIDEDASNTIAQGRLQELDAKIKAEEALLADAEKFSILEKEGDDAVKLNDLSLAKQKYEEALVLKLDTKVKDKLNDVSNKIAQKELKTKKISDLLAAGEELYKQSKWKEAKLKYQEVLTEDASNSQANQRIEELNQKIAEEEALLADNQKFLNLEKEGDDALQLKNLNLAKSKYEEALKVKTDAKVEGKLNDVKSQIALQQTKKQNITDLLAEGENLFNDAKWKDAQAKYQQVLIEESDNLIAKKKLDDIAQKIKEEEQSSLEIAEINNLKKQAEENEAQYKWKEAKDIYEQINAKKSDAAIVAKIEEMEANILNDSISLAKEASFEKLKKEGFDLADQKKWVDAKAKLEEAYKIKDESSVKIKLDEIEKEIIKSNDEKQNQKNFNSLIADAQKAETDKNYDKALKNYKDALSIYPSDVNVQNKITNLEAIIKKRNDELNADKDYQNYLTEGKNLMDQKKYAEAIKQFNEANRIKPNEKEPVDLATQAENLAKSVKSDDAIQLNKLLEASQNEINSKNYSKAKEYAERAQRNYPGDKRTVELLAQIEELIEVQKEYNVKISEAEKLAKAKKYDEAIKQYTEAKALKYDLVLPQQKIDELIVLKDAENNLANSNRIYSEYVSKGQDKEKAKDYAAAIAEFQNALNIKKNDQFAKDKIAELQQIIDNEKNRLAIEKSLNDNYNSHLKNGDDYMKLKNYEKAKESYSKAAELKPTENYPKNKLAEIEVINLSSNLKGKKLEDLGDPYFNSSMDGYALLVKSDLTSQQKNVGQIDNLQSQMNNKSNAVARENESVSLSNTAELSKTDFAIANKDADIKTKQNKSIALLDEARENLKNEELSFEKEGKNDVLENLTSIQKSNDQAEIKLVKANIQLEENKIKLEDFSEAKLKDEQKQYNQVGEDNAANMNQFVKLEDKEVNNQKLESINVNLNTQNLVNYEKNIETVNKFSEIKNNQDLLNNTQNLKATSEGLDKKNEQIRMDQQKNQIGMITLTQDIDELNKDQEVQNIQENIDALVKMDKAEQDVIIRNQQDIKNVQKNVMNLNNVSVKIEEAEIESNAADKSTQLKSITELNKVDDNISKKDNTTNKDQMSNQIQLTELVTDQQINEADQFKRNDAQNRENVVNYEQIKDEVTKEQKEHLSDAKKQIVELNKITENIEDNSIKSDQRVKSESLSSAQQFVKVEDKVEEKNAFESKEHKENNQQFQELNTQMSDNSIKDNKEIEGNQLKAVSEINSISTSLNEKKEKNDAVDYSKMEQLTNTANDNQNQFEKEQRLNQTENIMALEQLTETKKATQVVAPNEIGLAYPEGITEEYFTRKNADGQVIAFITRRIVVINQHGDVYTKTETPNLTAYTKNGTAITEISYEQQSEPEGLTKQIRTE